MSENNWSGITTCYTHKHHPNDPIPENTPKGLRKVWFLDAQWSTCPIEVEKEVKELWKKYDLGNDHYILSFSVLDLLEEDTKVPNIVKYIRENGIADNEQVIIQIY